MKDLAASSKTRTLLGLLLLRLGERVYFLCLSEKKEKQKKWPSMQSWREKTLRLAGANGIKSPHTFHVTIGFTASDIHDVDKDRTTLI